MSHKYVENENGEQERVMESYTDKGYGWWYPGEPDKGKHVR